MSSGSHFHETGDKPGDEETKEGPKGSTQQGQIDPDAVMAHIKRNQRRYKTAAVFLAGAYFGRKYGPVKTVVETVEATTDLKEHLIVAPLDQLKALVDEPTSFIVWEERGKPTITLITEANNLLR